MNFLLLCSFLSVTLLQVSAFVDPSLPRRQHAKLSMKSPILSTDNSDIVSIIQASRRDALTNLIMSVASVAPITTILLNPSSAHAAKLDPDTAYLNLRAAREELVVAGRKYFPNHDMEGLRDYLENDAVNMNNYELNAQALLESKRLDAESKKEIGTIRRYGVGADVIIMYGGLRSAMENDPVNFREAEQGYIRTLDSLEEVIAICRSNSGLRDL